MAKKRNKFNRAAEDKSIFYKFVNETVQGLNSKPTKYEVGDITDLDSEFVGNLKAGDILHSFDDLNVYIVFYIDNNQLMLSYVDNVYMSTITYVNEGEGFVYYSSHETDLTTMTHRYEVEDITEMSSAFVANLEKGDVVHDRGGLAYILNLVNSETKAFFYIDENMLTVVYYSLDTDENEWSYDETQNVNFETLGKLYKHVIEDDDNEFFAIIINTNPTSFGTNTNVELGTLLENAVAIQTYRDSLYGSGGGGEIIGVYAGENNIHGIEVQDNMSSYVVPKNYIVVITDTVSVVN